MSHKLLSLLSRDSLIWTCYFDFQFLAVHGSLSSDLWRFKFRICQSNGPTENSWDVATYVSQSASYQHRSILNHRTCTLLTTDCHLKLWMVACTSVKWHWARTQDLVKNCEGEYHHRLSHLLKSETCCTSQHTQYIVQMSRHHRNVKQCNPFDAREKIWFAISLEGGLMRLKKQLLVRCLRPEQLKVEQWLAISTRLQQWSGKN